MAHEFTARFPIITQKPVDQFASNFDWGNHGNVFRLVKNSLSEWVDSYIQTKLGSRASQI